MNNTSQDWELEQIPEDGYTIKNTYPSNWVVVDGMDDLYQHNENQNG